MDIVLTRMVAQYVFRAISAEFNVTPFSIIGEAILMLKESIASKFPSTIRLLQSTLTKMTSSPLNQILIHNFLL